jgi:hypothetical protein
MPGGELAPEVALGKFEQERRRPLGHLLQVIDGEQPRGLADSLPMQPVEASVAIGLVVGEVAEGVPQDGPRIPPVGMDAQSDLLAHGPRRQEHRGGLAQHFGHLAFQLPDHATPP